MALTHKICAQPVKAICLKTADGTSDYRTTLTCTECGTTLTAGECNGTYEVSDEMYAAPYIDLGVAGTILTSNGAAAAPTWQAPSGGGPLAFRSVNNTGSGGPFIANFEQQVANPFAVFPTGVLSTINRRLKTYWAGKFQTVVAEVPTLTLSVELANIDIISITSGALTASVTEGDFFFRTESVVITAGAAGILQTSAELIIALAGGTTYTTYRVKPTQSAATDLTTTARPKLNATCQITALTAVVLFDAQCEVWPVSIS